MRLVLLSGCKLQIIEDNTKLFLALNSNNNAVFSDKLGVPN